MDTSADLPEPESPGTPLSRIQKLSNLLHRCYHRAVNCVAQLSRAGISICSLPGKEPGNQGRHLATTPERHRVVALPSHSAAKQTWFWLRRSEQRFFSAKSLFPYKTSPYRDPIPTSVSHTSRSTPPKNTPVLTTIPALPTAHPTPLKGHTRLRK